MIKRLLIVPVLLFQFSFLAAQLKTEKKTNKNFNPKYRYFTNSRLPNGINVKGDITFIANSIVNRDGGTTNTTPEIGYNGSSQNGSFNMQYIDIDGFIDENNDGVDDTFSSSSSTLNIPNCSRIVYAALYWTALYPYKTWEGEEPTDSDFNTIKLKLPGNTSYTDITGYTIYNNNGDVREKPYLCYSDVTQSIKELKNPNGTYTTANIKAVTGYDNKNVGSAAGWTIVIVYENSKLTEKHISILDGFLPIYKLYTGKAYHYNFKTKLSGSVKTSVLVGALDGDFEVSGSQLQLEDPTHTGNFIDLSSGHNNSTDNFFNSSITINNEHSKTRNPSGNNTLGFDMDLFNLNNVGNTLIENKQTNTTFKFTTQKDNYWPFLHALVIENISPNIQLIKTIEDDAGNDLASTSIKLGDYIWYNINFQNTGNDNALNTVITSRLPKSVNFIEADLELPNSKITYDYESHYNHNLLHFYIPDDMVVKGSSENSIKIKIQVSKHCDDYLDLDSNIVNNHTYISYDSDQAGLPRVEYQTSSSGLDHCNFNIIEDSNLLVDTNNCAFYREEVLCGTSIYLDAGYGFETYVWTDASGNVIGNTQSISARKEGIYTVTKKASTPSFESQEIINVVPFGKHSNPLESLADKMLICPNYSREVAEVFLSEEENSKTLHLPFTSNSNTMIRWYQLDENSCQNETESECPIGLECTWKEIGDKLEQTFTEVGEYKLEILYSGRCPKDYYLKVNDRNLGIDQNSLNPLNIYPNPTSTILYTPEELHGKSYKIVNSLGKIIKEGKINMQISTQGLKNGIYLLKIQGYNGYKFLKF